MTWTEQNGPAVALPKRKGFGSTVLEKLAKMSLDADVRLEYSASGVVWHLTSPLARILHAGDVTDAEASHAEKVTEARRKKVLVVEDEPLSAIEVSQELVAAGFEVVGPARSVAQAFALLDTNRCDLAALDVNLGSETAEPIAHRLVDGGIPFLVMSGYSRDQLPSIFLNAKLLGKPLASGSLVREIQDLAEEDGP
jgi:CheY-like chemotaxis protein